MFVVCLWPEEGCHQLFLSGSEWHKYKLAPLKSRTTKAAGQWLKMFAETNARLQTTKTKAPTWLLSEQDEITIATANAIRVFINEPQLYQCQRQCHIIDHTPNYETTDTSVTSFLQAQPLCHLLFLPPPEQMIEAD